MRIAVGSDHAGFIQKDPIVEHIKSLGHEVLDFGPANDDRVDYPDFADKVARAVAAGKADRGVLICGTGIGIAMTADKVPGIRALLFRLFSLQSLLASTTMQMSLAFLVDSLILLLTRLLWIPS